MRVFVSEKTRQYLAAFNNCTCGQGVGISDAFCSHCGRPNRNFSAVCFEQQNELSFIEFFRLNCQIQPHEFVKKVFATERDYYEQNPFCPWCGQRFEFGTKTKEK